MLAGGRRAVLPGRFPGRPGSPARCCSGAGAPSAGGTTERGAPQAPSYLRDDYMLGRKTSKAKHHLMTIKPL